MPRRPLPDHAYALFDAKGPENAARVRRIVQLVSVLLERPQSWEGLRILDLGCGEGLFALEAALHGARVTAIDGRDERMSTGRALAADLRLDSVEFIHADVQSYRFEAHGPFDIVLLLGLLYHLDAPALFDVTRRAAHSTRRAMIVETHVARACEERVEHDGVTYGGWRYREHDREDAPSVRRARLLASLSGESSLWLTPGSLCALLRQAGFTTVLQCHAPLQPHQGEDRLTLVALMGHAPAIAAFPWINDASDDEVRQRARPAPPVTFLPPAGGERAAALLGVTVALGTWVRAHPEFVLGTTATAPPWDDATWTPAVAIWRRPDLDAYVGRLRRVPPALAVDVLGTDGNETVLAERAGAYVEAGADAAWLVLPATRRVLVVSASGSTLYEATDVLPPVPGLTGLRVVASDVLP